MHEPVCVCVCPCVSLIRRECAAHSRDTLASESSRFPESEGAQVHLNGDGTKLLEICPGKRH